jgi:calcium/calmodulin-dependent protein kinase (CaM kinase) II
MCDSTTTTELLALNRRLLESIATGDWATYEELCDPSLTCFEPEARGQWVEGMDFHHFYFKLGGGHRAAAGGPVNITISAPHVRVMGEVAVISFIRLVQKLDDNGSPLTARSEETRVWQRQGGRWRHVHFHRTVG